MNRSRLIIAALFGLAFTLSAQEVKLDIPGQQKAAPPAASATVPATTPAVAPAATPAAAPAAAPAATPPARVFTEAQIMEEFGWFVGKRLGLTDLDFSREQTDSLVKGLTAAAAGKDSPYDLDQIGPQMDSFMQKKQTTYLTKLRLQNLGEARAFFEKLKANKNVVELPDGLRYEIVKPGTGAYPKATDTVKVHYTGSLLNGTVFESSVQNGQPVNVQLDKVIPGWTEGLQKINQGGKIRLYIPPDLAYGDNPQGAIPPGSALVFDVELLEVNPATGAPATAKP